MVVHFLQPPLPAARIQLGVRRAKEGRQAVAVCTQALLLVKVVFPHDLAVRGHPAHVHLQRTLHLRHCSISAGRPGCHADDDVEESVVYRLGNSLGSNQRFP